MRSPKEQEALILLGQLTQALNTLTLWQSSTPSAKHMASTAAFHFDTLTFEQWLQFVFIERISLMIEKKQPLPNKISLSPMAEESFKGLGNKADSLLGIIEQLDCLLSGRKA